MIGDPAPPNKKIGDMASHAGSIRLIDILTVFRSRTEQEFINKLFDKLARGDAVGLDRSLRSRAASSLRRRGVL